MSGTGESVFKPLLGQGVGYGVVVGVGFFFAGVMLVLTYLQSKYSDTSPSSSEEFTVGLFLYSNRVERCSKGTVAERLAQCEIGGAATVNALTGMSIEAACMLLPVGIAVYVIFGGLRATFVCDWSHTIILFIVIYIFVFRTYGTSPDIGSYSKMYELLQQAGVDTPVLGNAQGSYLTMKSNQGLVFGAATIPKFPTYPNPLSASQASAGLAAPAAAAVLMGKGGAIAVLLVVFMAVTSAASAELIGVSSLFSYDLYRTYYRPQASGKEIVRVSHIFICVWAIWMGCWAVILNKAKIDLGWLFYVQGVALSPAVVPIGLTVTWSKLTRAGVFAGTIGGLILGMCSWMIGCWKIYGTINITNLALPYSAVCSGLTGLLFSGILTVGVSLINPDNYDFKGTRAIARYDDGPSAKPIPSDHAWEKEPSSPSIEKDGTSENGADKNKDRVSVIDVTADLAESQDKDTEMRKTMKAVFKRAAVYSVILTLIVMFIVPLPMFFSHYIFSEKFYAFWTTCTILWVLMSGAFCIVLPLWESRTEIAHILGGAFRSMTGRP
ncbi:hypothetical protein EWM64_g4363 [Hericium alpestre]|uniref:Urea active transporter n=1 Tax=Hericium alpestre TaxID=135208 RepID=A0A4Z0A1R4_9AGAM|nr:hypothetical protein EWM64_g4363 [Hericium alpestre]